MGIPRAEMLSPDTRHVEQQHDPPEQNVVQVDALSESLLSLKNYGDRDRRLVHGVRCYVLCDLQQV
jgi:hypothetical protein